MRPDPFVQARARCHPGLEDRKGRSSRARAGRTPIISTKPASRSEKIFLLLRCGSTLDPGTGWHHVYFWWGWQDLARHRPDLAKAIFPLRVKVVWGNALFLSRGHNLMASILTSLQSAKPGGSRMTMTTKSVATVLALVVGLSLSACGKKEESSSSSTGSSGTSGTTSGTTGTTGGTTGTTTDQGTSGGTTGGTTGTTN